MIMLQIVLVVSTNVCGSTNGHKFCTGSIGNQVCCGVNGVCDVVYCSEPNLCQESVTGGYNSPGPIHCYSNSKSKGTTPAAQATFDAPSKPLYHEPLPMECMNLFPTREFQHLVLEFRLMPQVVLHAHNLHSPQPIMDTINTSFSILYRSKVHGLNT
jgi:hypothetical protein